MVTILTLVMDGKTYTVDGSKKEHPYSETNENYVTINVEGYAYPLIAGFVRDLNLAQILANLVERFKNQL